MTALIALDFGLLTLLLALAGGASNPFSVLYLVHIALAAIVLRERMVWGLALLAISCFGLLFVLPSILQPEATHTLDHAMGDMHLHYEGMWLAFTVAAIAIVYFVTHVTRDLEKQRSISNKARNAAMRNEKLATLATLAAGAAHELATPLSTIAIAAKELERHDLSAEVKEDIVLIREEVTRCRSILNHMASEAGESAGEGFTYLTVSTLFDNIQSTLYDKERIALTLGKDTDTLVLYAPARALAQALRGLIKNALDASTTRINISVATEKQWMTVIISDSGTGMSEETLAHIGEPFWSTKETGRGMGLGVFLAKNTLEKLGGTLHITSIFCSGTNVTIKIPCMQQALAHD